MQKNAEEIKARPRVYVIEQQAFDYAPATVYGDLVFLDTQKLAPHIPEAGSHWNDKVLHQIRRELSSYVPGLDFIIPTGPPAKLLAVGAILRDRGPAHHILGWDARSQRYLHYVLSVQ